MLISQTENRICVELTREDMARLDITYDELDYANIETRRVLWTLLDDARRTLGREISLTQRMYIEALPGRDGGCSIFFTLGKGTCARLVKRGGAIVCQSPDLEALCRMLLSLSRLHPALEAELYEKAPLYRVLLRTADGADELVRSRCCEFAQTSVSPLREAATLESWRLLSSDAFSAAQRYLGASADGGK